MNLVVGATGALGSEICRLLREADKPVRGLVRSTAETEKLESLQRLGVEFAYGDLKHRESLDAACQGVDTVLTTATTTVSRQPDDTIEATDRDGSLALVAAAKESGVERFVYLSYSKNIDNVPEPCALTQAKRAVESRVQSSGMTFTILRPSYFMEVWLSPRLGFDYVDASATIYGSGNHAISWISRGDVADYAVKCLENREANNAVLELGGPQALSPMQVVSVFEQASGRAFTVNHVPVEVLQEQRENATDTLQESFAALMLSHEAGDEIPSGETSRLFSVDLLGVTEYAATVVELV